MHASATEQHSLKIDHLRQLWRSKSVRFPLPDQINYRETGVGGSRDRVDLTFDQPLGATPKLGLFDRFRTGIVDLQGCPQLSPALESFLQAFRLIRFPISRGSVRLRVSPSETRGVWFDFANVDVKALLDEKTTLLSMLEKNWIVEIGQKRKRLEIRESGDGEILKLGDPVLYPWFETYLDGVAVPLYTTIGNFTQPGFRANKILIDEVMSLVPTSGTKAAEFGAGIGNFTLPLAARFRSVDVYEIDALALEGLTRTLEEQKKTNSVQIFAGNYQGDKALGLNFTDVDLLLVDPPRSGLMKFIDSLAAAPAKPQKLLYVSCFAESFAQDSDRLFEMGYELEKVSIVDQFPQSRHYETVALFKYQP